MVFINYCAVFFSPTDGVEKEVSKIAEGKARKITGTGISIFTFSSVIEVTVLTEFFKSFNRNFLLFDLDKNSSGFNLLDKNKENELFGFLNNTNIISEYEALSNKLMDDIIDHNISGHQYTGDDYLNDLRFICKSAENVNTNEDLDYNYDNLSKSEINNEVNKIIDKGVENLTEYDKKILKKLTSLI